MAKQATGTGTFSPWIHKGNLGYLEYTKKDRHYR
jgi:hypothetical protein